MGAETYCIVASQETAQKVRRAFSIKPLSSAEELFTIIMLMYSAGAVLPLLTRGNDVSESPTDGPIDMAVKLALYAFVFIFAGMQWRIIARCVWAMKWILLPVLIAVMSVFWSQYPFRTVTGAGVLLGTTLFGLYFGARYTVPQQLRLLVYSYSAAIVLSFIFALALPKYGIETGQLAGHWRGVFIQKNNLAENMVLALFAFLLLGRSINRGVRVFGIVGTVVLICLAGSATAIVVSVILGTFLPLVVLLRFHYSLSISILLFVGLLITLGAYSLTSDSTAFWHVLGRSSDLTGRTEVWEAVWHSAGKRPWLGYGFNAFWTGKQGESEVVLDSIGWSAGYSHNGYLDVLIQVGVVGLVAYGVGYISLLQRAVASLSGRAGTLPLWPCFYVAFMLVYNCSEGDILVQNSLYWALYVSTAVNLLQPFVRSSLLD